MSYPDIVGVIHSYVQGSVHGHQVTDEEANLLALSLLLQDIPPPGMLSLLRLLQGCHNLVTQL